MTCPQMHRKIFDAIVIEPDAPIAFHVLPAPLAGILAEYEARIAALEAASRDRLADAVTEQLATAERIVGPKGSLAEIIGRQSAQIASLNRTIREMEARPAGEASDPTIIGTPSPPVDREPVSVDEIATLILGRSVHDGARTLLSRFNITKKD
jgi:hypothetical protein